MNNNTIIKELKDGILTITINRPKQLNAININTLGELEIVIQDAYYNVKVKGIIITGAGNKAFVSGADIKEFANFNSEQGGKMVTKGQSVLKMIENCPKPIVAAVNGFAIGGGCELAMACHLRIASKNAKFGQPEVKLGIIPAYGGTQRMTQLIGKTMAFELLMTGAIINASQAQKIGLVNYITSYDNLIIKTKELLNKILVQSPVAIESVISCVNAYYSNSLDGYKKEVIEFKKCLDKNDFKEGVRAFIEKRKPKFNNTNFDKSNCIIKE